MSISQTFSETANRQEITADVRETDQSEYRVPMHVATFVCFDLVLLSHAVDIILGHYESTASLVEYSY